MSEFDILTASVSQQHISTAEGYGTSYTYYFLPDGFEDFAALPVGSVFGMVSSPSLYSPPQLRRWNLAWLRVSELVSKRTGELERWYTQVEVVDLREWEIARFEEMITGDES